MYHTKFASKYTFIKRLTISKISSLILLTKAFRYFSIYIAKQQNTSQQKKCLSHPTCLADKAYFFTQAHFSHQRLFAKGRAPFPIKAAVCFAKARAF